MNVHEINGLVMSKDIPVAEIRNGEVSVISDLCPLFLKRTKNLEQWLKNRSIDSHRTNSRLLKRLLRLSAHNDIDTVLRNHAATITDTYWIKLENEALSYSDTRYSNDLYSNVALCGKLDSLDFASQTTPELTNIGSFEKCWKRKDDKWIMYKAENELERFSELFVCRIAKLLEINTVLYNLDEQYVTCPDFTNDASVNFESADCLFDDETNYEHVFDMLSKYGDLCTEYLQLIYLDAICFNFDRHLYNFGILRDIATGDILSLAPNFDNNLALVSNGVRHSYDHDVLTDDFIDLVSHNEIARKTYESLNFHFLKKDDIDHIISEIGFIPDGISAEYLFDFVNSRQFHIEHEIQEKIQEIEGREA